MPINNTLLDTEPTYGSLAFAKQINAGRGASDLLSSMDSFSGMQDWRRGHNLTRFQQERIDAERDELLGRAKSFGVEVPSFAGGGQVLGPPGLDQVPAIMPDGSPARLDDGEYVLPDAVVRALGGPEVLDKLVMSVTGQPPGPTARDVLPVQGEAVPAFARGGEVEEALATLPPALRSVLEPAPQRVLTDIAPRRVEEGTGSSVGSAAFNARDADAFQQNRRQRALFGHDPIYGDPRVTDTAFTALQDARGDAVGRMFTPAEVSNVSQQLPTVTQRGVFGGTPIFEGRGAAGEPLFSDSRVGATAAGFASDLARLGQGARDLDTGRGVTIFGEQLPNTVGATDAVSQALPQDPALIARQRGVEVARQYLNTPQNERGPIPDFIADYFDVNRAGESDQDRLTRALGGVEISKALQELDPEHQALLQERAERIAGVTGPKAEREGRGLDIDAQQAQALINAGIRRDILGFDQLREVSRAARAQEQFNIDDLAARRGSAAPQVTVVDMPVRNDDGSYSDITKPVAMVFDPSTSQFTINDLSNLSGRSSGRRLKDPREK